MVWFRVDDHLYDHLKVTGIPRRRRLPALGLWVLAGAWSAGHLTDGRLPADVVQDLGGTPQTVADLLESGLWIAVDDYYEFHSWTDYQLSRAEVERERALARERQKRRRAKRLPQEGK